MADDDKKQNIIIIKKKKGHGGAHGGAWKVAYADFVTAMMAFFLLMWLLNSITKEQKEGLADYFLNHSIFTEGGNTFMQKPNRKPTPPADDKAKPKGKPTVIQLNPDDFEGQKLMPFQMWGKYKVKPKEFAEQFQKELDKQLGEMKDQVKVEVTEDGVRVQLVDADGRDMFQSGAEGPTALGRKAMKVIADSFKKMPNPIAIDGHTDAVGQDEGRNGNWALSTNRALATRSFLENEGVDATQFRRVTGYADSELYTKDDPMDPRNRRVAITLLFPRPEPDEEVPEEP